MIMVIKLSDLLGITFVLSTLLSEISGVDTVIGHFHMTQQHPELKECAAAMMQENECVAVRRSKLTGQCESLPQSWGKDEIMESGYDYAKKIFVQENFQPPREVALFKDIYWKIPGVLKTGAKIDVFMSLLPGFQGPNIILTSLLGTVKTIWNRGHHFRLNFLDNKIQVFESIDSSNMGDKYVENWSVKAGSKLEVKMSWLAQKDSVALYANDVELLTYRLNVSLDAMKQIYLNEAYRQKTVTVNRLQFTA